MPWKRQDGADFIQYEGRGRINYKLGRSKIQFYYVPICYLRRTEMKKMVYLSGSYIYWDREVTVRCKKTDS